MPDPCQTLAGGLIIDINDVTVQNGKWQGLAAIDRGKPVRKSSKTGKSRFSLLINKINLFTYLLERQSLPLAKIRPKPQIFQLLIGWQEFMARVWQGLKFYKPLPLDS